jgi:hypothetical protein
VDETTMSKHNGSPPSRLGSVTKNVADFTSDIVTLMELQLQLLKADAQDCFWRIAVALSLMVAAFAALLGCFAMALMSLAYGLIQLGFSAWSAFLTAAGLGMVVVIVLGMIGWLFGRKAPTVFHRSQDEFKSNVDWVKQVLTAKEVRQ